MENVINFIASNILMSVLTILGFLGTALGLIQNHKNKTELGKYEYLFNIASQNMDLEDKSKIIDDYQTQINHMQIEIEERIPIEAKRIALNEMLSSELSELSTTYSKVKSLQDQLVEIGEKSNSDNRLINDVISTIEPSYTQNRSNNLFNMIFYSVSLFSSILSFVLPGDIYQFIAIIIAIFQFAFIVKMVSSYIKYNYSKDEIFDYLRKSLLFASIFSLIISLFALFFVIIEPFRIHISHDGNNFIITVSLITYIIHIIFDILFYCKDLNNRKKKATLTLLANVLIIIGIILLFTNTYDTVFAIGLLIILISTLFEIIISLSILLNRDKQLKRNRFLKRFFKMKNKFNK